MANGRAAIAGTTAIAAPAEPSHTPLARAARWARANLFSSWLSTAITLVLAYLLFKMLASLISWAFLNAIWTLPQGDSDFSTRWARIKRSFTRAWVADGGWEGSVSDSRRRNRRVRTRRALRPANPRARSWPSALRFRTRFLL